MCSVVSPLVGKILVIFQYTYDYGFKDDRGFTLDV